MRQDWRRRFHLPAVIGTIPMILVAVGVFVIGIGMSVLWSFTASKLFPNYNFVGLMQYRRLWGDTRWQVSVHNIWIFGLMSIACNMVFGYLLAVFMDQRIKQEDLFRSIFLYPFAMSLIVTGLVWQWALDPNFGLQASVRSWGWTNFTFAPLVNANTAIFGLVVAGIWQGSGVSMAILLAGLRGIDGEIWKAAKVDGIPTWRTHLFIVAPMMRGAFATAFVLQCVSVVRVYDLVIAMTGGGPGIATTMPAVYVIQLITVRQNVGQGMAAATLLLLPVLIVLLATTLLQWRRRRMKEAAI
jgi:glucose/mannose transport system permease protein